MLRRNFVLGSIAPIVSRANNDPSLEIETLEIGGSTLRINIRPGDLKPSHDEIVGWLTKAARAVTAYYGRFPVPVVRIVIHPAEGRHGVFHGTTWGSDPPLIRIFVGEDTTPGEFQRDWMMTHEMVHLSFPDLDDDYHWMEEGVATYVEPIARILIGDLVPQDVWKGMMDSMPQGQPKAGDEGLNRTHTWGRTYWGGAMFWLLADVRLLQATRTGKGLRDALRGIQQAGGSIDKGWPVEKVLATGDAATGQPVLANLYREFALKPEVVDLSKLWEQLGIARVGNTVIFDDRAPLAAVRRAITPANNEKNRASGITSQP